MIKILKSANDKMNMILIIKLINKRIKLFFDNLKLNKITNLNDEEIIANILNINGSWGSGKSTIVNNLENYYQYKNAIEKPKFLIINLWEYETSSDPYFDLINDIANKLISFSKINEQKKQQEITKIRKLSFSLRIKYYDWEFTPGIGYESSKKINNQKLMKEIIEEIINELNSFVNKNKIVVIFDELDRCTPTNQIIFLSYIKNIFCKITNIFFIVSSNNEVINANISNISIQKDNILNEKYTDKIFNVSISLKDIFFVENMNFSTNDYIQEFMKKENIINARIIKRLQIQVNKTINYLKKIWNFFFFKR